MQFVVMRVRDDTNDFVSLRLPIVHNRKRLADWVLALKHRMRERLIDDGYRRRGCRVSQIEVASNDPGNSNGAEKLWSDLIHVSSNLIMTHRFHHRLVVGFQVDHFGECCGLHAAKGGDTPQQFGHQFALAIRGVNLLSRFHCEEEYVIRVGLKISGTQVRKRTNESANNNE